MVMVAACGPGVEDEDELADGSGGAVDTGAEPDQDDATGGGGATDEPGEDSSGGGMQTTGDGDPTTGAPEVELPQGCQCTLPEEDLGCDALATTACDGEVLCETVTRSCARPPDFYACDGAYEYDEEALDCALGALRDRTVGFIEVASENDVCGFEGCGTDRWRISIRGADVSVVERCSSSPLDAESSHGTLRQLAEPAFFEACLGMPSAAMRYGCLFDGLSDDVDVCEPD